MGCKFCNRIINNKGSLKAHEMSCIDNPDKIKHKHSEKAGAKKGVDTWNKGLTLGRSEHWEMKYPIHEVCVVNSTYGRKNLKKRLIANNLIPYNCAICNIGPIWMDKSMPLILDHINGIYNDHRLDNFRFVCSNCDTQLPTYKSKNKNRNTKIKNKIELPTDVINVE